MAASKPTSWLSQGAHFVRLTQAEFRGLRRRSGFFSSRGRTLAPAPLLQGFCGRAFGVRQDLTGGEALASYRSLYLAPGTPHAAPKCLSGSTSYLQVWASIPRYRDFTLAKCRSLGFASATADCTPYSGSLSLRLPASSRLTSPATATRRFIMQKARRHTHKRAPTACRRMVSGSVSLPSTGCFPPFPHGTCSLSVSREYLALPDGPGGFAQGFSCPALLREPLRQHRRRVRGFHPLWPDVPVRSA